MAAPLIVLCAVGLTPAHLGSDTPALARLAGRGRTVPLTPALPAVTTTAQTTMLTGVDPSSHGIVGNGWYFRELGEVWLWRQSQRLIEAPLVWQDPPAGRPRWEVLKHFWWYAMNTDVAATATPRPAYHADGAKSPDFYTRPVALHERLQATHGPFPLFHFWGPTASVLSSRWIADAFVTAWQEHRPQLALCYLPHLDYDLQRYGPDGDHLAGNLRDLDDCCRRVLELAESAGARVLVVSEYGIEAVDHGIFINRHLRQRGLLEVTTNATGELLDPGASRAFAVADHQLAHVYCRAPGEIDEACRALKELPGIERLFVGDERAKVGLDHRRAGDIVAIAEAGTWFAYDYWLDDARRPDFANNVEIHRKPGYDPRELFFDPAGGKTRALWALLRKKCGFRYRMNPVPLDDRLVQGSHGRPPSSAEAGPVLISSEADGALPAQPHQRDVATLIRQLLA